MIAEIDRPWDLSIASKKISLDHLSSWTDVDDPDIKYFSGTAAYANHFEMGELEQSTRCIINLGEVKNLAEVHVNGKKMGILWKKPFKIDITEALVPGDNTLEIHVTNLWVNRLIGDAQTGAEKTTFTTMPFYQADSPLLVSGLLGPVKLVQVR